jgi:methyl-accepting chemotaxis protein
VGSFAASINFRIVAAFSVCVALTCAVGAFGLQGLSRMNSALKSNYSQNTIAISALSEIRSSQLESRLQLLRIVYFRDPAKTKIAIDIVRADWARIDKAWNDYHPDTISMRKERGMADGIKDLLGQVKSLTNTAILAAEAGDYDAATAAILKQAKIADPIQQLINDDVALNISDAKQSAEDNDSMFETLLLIGTSLVGVSIVLAIGVSTYLTRAISKPLNVAVGVANQIACGELDNRIVVSSRDEFGQLLEALRKMDGQLSGSVRGIKTSAESVTVVSREIATGNTDLSARTEEQAASLEETAASMTQLTETVKQNADNARQANTLATRATDIADAGNEAVQGMVRTIDKINDSSTKISEITGVIEGIAFQTNILALNAAVEAARAGEQGRGFAVVASEVRSLAQRSAAAAKEIKELIGSSVAMIEDGAKQATQVGATMGEVKQAIKRVSDIVGAIADASEEQSRGIEQVNQAVGQMDEVTQQNAALVEQSAAAAYSLEEQAQTLKAAVAVFKLADMSVISQR